ncbi:MAG: AMP-binding protein [Betaproteobacteria bacterium]|nr:AMP-binding protein [Betaproteobacteria bacterium]
MEPRHFRFWPKHLPRRLSYPRTTVHALLEVSARRYPDKAHSIFYGAHLSYADALAQVNALAGFLQQDCGVRRGDRVLLDMQNAPQFVLAFYAILRADAVVVPVSPMYIKEELSHYIADSGAKVALIGQEVFPEFSDLIGRPLEHVIVAAYSDYASADDPLPKPEAVAAPRQDFKTAAITTWTTALAAGRFPGETRTAPQDLCALPYTSGSTGAPKGCMHTHASLIATTLGAVLWENVYAESVSLATAPFFHVTGMQHSMNAAAYTGATLVIQPRWDAHIAAQLIERHRCTHWANVPTMVVDLLSHPQALAHDVSSLQCIFGGGSAMPEAIAQKLYETCGIQYLEGYGMTETISQTHMNPANHPKQQCLGIPTFDTESRIVDPERFAALGPGEQGEIVVRGPQLLCGYWNKDQAFRESWVEIEGERYFRTGDLGRMDEEGYYFISDRLKRMINTSGFKVWPAEVEAAMYRHPAIQECCIIASPDERRGETVKLVAVLKPEARDRVSAGEIIEWARARMAAYKIPRKVEFTDQLPRTASGKLQWRALQEKEFGG